MRYLITLLLLFCSSVFADNVLVIHQNYGGAHTNIGARLTAAGHTVTYSTSGVPSSLSGYTQVWDISYSTGYSTAQVTTLDTFVKDGGFLMMNGENSSFMTRNNSIGSVVSAAGGGTITWGSGSNSYTVINSDFSNDTGTVTGAAGSSITNSQGQYLVKTSSGVIGAMIWQSGDLGSGYSGTIFVTADINMWDSNYGSTLLKVNIVDDLLAMEDAGTLYGSSGPTTSTTTGTSGGITSAQSSSKSSARTRSNNQSDNTVYIDQVGDNNTVTIEQDGTATNTVRGIYSSGDDAGLIQGDSNTIEIRQGADTSTSSNLIEFKIIGSSNDVLLYQDRTDLGAEDSIAGGGHNIILDVYGSTNDIDIIQRNNYDTHGGHYVDLEVAGSSNGIDLKQISDYSKDIFGKVTGSNNAITVYQHENSNKYLDFTITGDGHTLDVEQTGTGAHNAEITLINGSAPSTVNLLQQGSTDQSYSLEQTCYTTGGCTVDVTQGN